MSKAGSADANARVTWTLGANPLVLKVESDYAAEADLTLTISAQNKYV